MFCFPNSTATRGCQVLCTFSDKVALLYEEGAVRLKEIRQLIEAPDVDDEALWVNV